MVRQWDMVKSFEQWLEMMQKRVSIGVFDPRLIALITLEPTDNGIFEVHVDCKRRINLTSLYIALMSVRKTVFEQWGAREVFAGVISRNRGIIAIAEQCGFKRDGVEETVGNLRWIRMRITDVEYQNEYKHEFGHAVGPVQPTEQVRALAGSI